MASSRVCSPLKGRPLLLATITRRSDFPCNSGSSMGERRASSAQGREKGLVATVSLDGEKKERR